MNGTALLHIPHWSANYLGLPWRQGGLTRNGISCWGMVRLPYAERLGLPLPSYVGEPGREEAAEIEACLAGDADRWPWREVDESEVREFDLVMFRLGDVESHVGIVPWRGSFLHIAEGVQSRIERYSLEPWKPLVSRFLRHRVLDEARGNVSPLPPTGTLLALPALDPLVRRIDLSMPPGGTVADAVKLALPGLPPEQYDRLRVTVGPTWIPQGEWEATRPALNEVVLIRVAPGDFLKQALMLAVVVAAVAIGQFYLGPLIAGAIVPFGAPTAGTLGAVNAATVAALTIGGSLLLNALIPTRGPEAAKQVFAINGFQNTALPDGPVPQLLGEMRFAPPYGMLPRGEVVNDERWVVVPFIIGQGPVDLSDAEPRIGLTPITDFDENDYQINLREGYADDDPLEFCREQIIEEPLSIALTFEEGPQVRFTARDITRWEIEFFFPGGLVIIDEDGDNRAAFVSIKVEERKVGDVPWTTVFESDVWHDQREPFWRALEHEVPVRGQYELRITRTSEDNDDAAVSSLTTISALRSFRPEYPFNYAQPMAMAEVRIRASGKLNGTLDTLNVLGRRVCLDWDAGTETWITRATSNPASIARLILQGPQNTYPEPDSALDLATWQEWHAYCTLKGLTYNDYIVDATTREDALADVCHAGRALPYRRGNQWTIIVDKPRTQFYDHIGTRNSWGLKETDPPVSFPDAFAVSFIDATNNYIQARRVVPWPGFVGTPIIVEDLPLPGKTNSAEVWIEARRRQYEAIHRRRSWTVGQDAEHLAIGRGDAGFLAHPVIDRRQSAGRVRGVSETHVTLDEQVTMEATGTYRVRFRKSDGSTIERSVTTVAGTTRTLAFGDSGDQPDEGDLALFYSMAEPVREVIAKLIERTEHHGAQLTLIDHAPQIDTLTDAEVAPAWDGRVGEIVDFTAPAPGVPSFADFDFDADTSELTALIAGGGGTAAKSYTIAHRLEGVGSFTTVAVTATESAVTLSDYEIGDSVELKVLATNLAGASSAYSGVTVYAVAIGHPTADSTHVTADSTTLTADLH